MKLLVVILALCLTQVRTQGLFGFGNTNVCTRDITADYKKGLSDFHTKLYERISARSNNHFVYSPHSIWLSLAALAEGADSSIQAQLFKALNLPQERCLRQKFYDTALHVEKPGNDVTILRQRSLVIDDGLKVKPNWNHFVKSQGILDVETAPIKTDPKEASRKLKKLLKSRSNISVTGNSVLLDSVDYNGLWTTAFSQAEIKNESFHNAEGLEIGIVPMMRMKKNVRIAQIPFTTTKVIELPVGENGRYTMLVALGIGAETKIVRTAFEAFIQIFPLLSMSLVPLNIAIPMFSLTSAYDARIPLEEIGLDAFWHDPAATREATSPPAIPGGLLQRVSIHVGSKGIAPPPVTGTDLLSGIVNFGTGVATTLGFEFTANKPFMYGLFDTDTKSCIFAGVYSRPHKSKV